MVNKTIFYHWLTLASANFVLKWNHTREKVCRSSVQGEFGFTNAYCSNLCINDSLGGTLLFKRLLQFVCTDQLFANMFSPHQSSSEDILLSNKHPCYPYQLWWCEFFCMEPAVWSHCTYFSWYGSIAGFYNRIIQKLCTICTCVEKQAFLFHSGFFVTCICKSEKARTQQICMEFKWDPCMILWKLYLNTKKYHNI